MSQMKALALLNALVVITTCQILAYSCNDLQCSKIIILRKRAFLMRFCKILFYKWIQRVLLHTCTKFHCLWYVLGKLFQKIAKFFVRSVP